MSATSCFGEDLSIVTLVLVLLLAGCSAAPSSSAGPSPTPINVDDPFSTYAPRNRPDVAGTRGAVVASHPLAAAAGHEVLLRGGNAVDAAVTMAAVLAVVRPHMNGVGGDALALFYRSGTGEVLALDASGRAGALATREFFGARDLRSIPGRGALSVTVPGAVSGWAAALERFGTISLAQALQPAIRYAEEGFPVSAILSYDIALAADALNPPGRAIFAPSGAPAEGSLQRNPALGRSLRRIAEEGPGALYGGVLGRAIADFVTAEGGYLRIGDLAAHTPEWVDPISVDHLGLRVYAMPPSSQGITLLQQMALAAHLPLGDLPHNGAEYLHALVEVKKVAFADRDRWIGDRRESAAHVAKLLDPDYLRQRARLVGDMAASSIPAGLEGGTTASVGDGSGDTVYLMAVDGEGNAVSWIQSLFASFGSTLVEPSTGIVLHNRGSQFTLQAGHPNEIGPGKRPFHTLTPHLATNSDGSLALLIGTPGGDSQPQSVFQVFQNIYRFGMAPQQAVEAPRFRSFGGRRLSIESRIPPEVRAELLRRGHEVSVVDGWSESFGGIQVIQVDPVSKALRTGADPRREAYGIAY
jgi:gamma-glutamyltranspeptidase / glutathione hydrolase